MQLVTDSLQLNVPKRLPLTDVGKVTKVSAGGTACVVLNGKQNLFLDLWLNLFLDKNQVYVWGFGLLGKGPLNESIRSPSLIPEIVFGCNDFNPDLKIIDVVAGLRHFAAISSKLKPDLEKIITITVILDEGDLYMWGKNRNGCLGFVGKKGHTLVQDQFFPLKVDLPALIKKVRLGVDHTIVIATNI